MNIDKDIESLKCCDQKEEFKIITYPGIDIAHYAISNYGKIVNLRNNKLMKTYFDKDGYERITLCTNVKLINRRGKKSKHYSIHRLVAWEFIGPPPDSIHNVVNHKNGIVKYNFVDNLEWCSVLDNTNHAKETGLMNTRGTSSKNCKYSEKLINRICEYFENGFNNVEIYELITGNRNYKEHGEASGLYNLINKLGKRTSYRDIVEKYDYRPDMSYFNCNEEISIIRKMIGDGCTNYDILYKFGYHCPSDNYLFYNRIISERAKCKVLFNDYRKHN